jgi:Mg2+ and Co2+ transporter CorA
LKRVFICTYEDELGDTPLKFDELLDVTEIGEEHILGALPQALSEFLIFNFENGDDIIAVDLAAVIDMLDYLTLKPKTVSQLLIKLSAAVNQMYHQTGDQLIDAKEALEDHVARRTSFYANEAHDLNFKRTAANIESFVRAEPTWKKLNRRVQQLGANKSRLWSTKELLSNTLDIVKTFANNAPNVTWEDPGDRSFADIAGATVTATAQINGATNE